jgi:uncharacterized delta-60 repeat protein
MGRFKLLLATIGAVAVVFAALASAAYAAGELDPSFDGDGRVVTDFGPGDDASGIAIQADGKIVAAGSSNAGVNPANFALARYDPDGSLDLTFDNDGRVVTNFGTGNDVALGVAIQADGKIVAAGFSNSGGNDDFALARYNPAGSLDPSFDGDGRVVTDLGGNFEQAFGVAIQADGKIVAAGFSDSGANPQNFALARYNPDGSLDPSFDGDGGVVTDFGAFDFPHAVAIQGDGKIVAAGFSGAGANPDNFALARYNLDGSLDPSFDGDGTVVTDFGDIDQAFSVAIQADGRIVAAGRSFAGADFALARYNPDGSLDSSFDGDGRVLTDFGADNEASGVAIQTDGRIVVAGVSGGDFALARYNTDGSLDPSFDGDGRVVTDFGAFDFPHAVAIQGDGKIVAAGVSGADFNSNDFALARYLPDGGPVNRPPDCSTVTPGTDTLWPPDHTLQLVTLGRATDPDGDTVTLTITAVTQDEPLNGLSDGNTSPDAQAASQSNEILLRAERNGSGDGRVYRVSFTGADGQGGSCSGTVTVGVPRNMGTGSTAIDSAPQSFNSFGP